MAPDYNVSQIPRLESSVVSAKEYEDSRIVQLNFKTEEELDIAIKFGIKIEYCLFRVTLSIEKPKKCLNCQGFGHFVRDCKNPVKFNKCRGDQTNKDQACSSQIVEFANCGGNHRGNSLMCPELKKHLPVQRASGRCNSSACV